MLGRRGDGRLFGHNVLPPPGQPSTFLPWAPTPSLPQISALCPGEPAANPAGHIWQALCHASCWPSGEWQPLGLMAGAPGGRERMNPQVHLMFLSPLDGMASGCP
jgi:hypothetical protein